MTSRNQGTFSREEERGPWERGWINASAIGHHLVFSTGYSFPVSSGFRRLKTGLDYQNKGRERWSWTRKKQNKTKQNKNKNKNKKQNSSSGNNNKNDFFFVLCEKEPLHSQNHFGPDRCRLFWKESLIISRAMLHVKYCYCSIYCLES